MFSDKSKGPTSFEQPSIEAALLSLAVTAKPPEATRLSVRCVDGYSGEGLDSSEIRGVTKISLLALCNYSRYLS
jgi:hypothetical protein